MTDAIVKGPQTWFKRLRRVMEGGRAGPGRQRAIAQDYNPYRLPDPPPWVRQHVPSSMAMDQELNADGSSMSGLMPWAAGSQLESAWLEGLAFLGYPYLAQLALRAEYRHMIGTIATECTRKWVKFQAVQPKYGKGKKKDPEGPKEALARVQAGGGEEREGGEAEDAEPAFEREQDEEREQNERQAQSGEKEERQEHANKAKYDKIEKLKDEFERLAVREATRCWLEHDGFFGRGHLYFDIKGAAENPEEMLTPIGNGWDELSKLKVGKGQLLAMRPVEPVWIYPIAYNTSDPTRADWYKPQTWYVMANRVHCSRLLTMIGREVPDILKPAFNFGGLAMSQLAKPYVDNWLRTRQSVSDLIHSFSIMVLQTDLSTTLMGDGDELFDRIDFFNRVRDNRGLFVANKETEDVKNVAAPLGTLDHLQAQAQEQMCSVAQIPVVKFTGIQPSGLNADSDGVIRTFYDNIAAYQERLVRPCLRTVMGMAMLNLWGDVDREIDFAFEPLWALDEKGEADVRKVEAETGQILVDTGIISQEEERQRVADDESGPYQGLDPEDVPELLEAEMGGLVPGKGAGAGLKAIFGEEGLVGGEGGPTNGKGGERGGGNAVTPFRRPGGGGR